MNFLIMAGHSDNGYLGSGAVGIINESTETRRVGPVVVDYLHKLGQNATYLKLDKPTTSSYLNDQVKLANSKGEFDCVVQIHFNAGSKDANDEQAGTETYYRSENGKIFAVRVNNKLNELFRKRSTGARNDKPNLYWLKYTSYPAILIEVCFVDDKDDVRVYQENFDKICRLIAEGLANKTIQELPGDFNPITYLKLYKDVLLECMHKSTFKPLDHYKEFGAKEGRVYNNDIDYLFAYEDVLLAVNNNSSLSAEKHYLDNGKNEGRQYK